jgi:hypothetical protein
MQDICTFNAEATPAVRIAKKGNWFASASEDDRAIRGEELTCRFGWIGNFIGRK